MTRKRSLAPPSSAKSTLSRSSSSQSIHETVGIPPSSPSRSAKDRTVVTRSSASQSLHETVAPISSPSRSPKDRTIVTRSSASQSLHETVAPISSPTKSPKERTIVTRSSPSAASSKGTTATVDEESAAKPVDVITSRKEIVSSKDDPLHKSPTPEEGGGSSVRSPTGSRASVSRSPTRKTESECSFTMSIPDSPSGMGATHEPSTPSRRSARIARKLSTDSTTMSVEPDPITTRASRKRSADSADLGSVKSEVSATESVSSRASRSSSRKRSYSRLELRKSSVKPQFKQLEVIMSDEEKGDSENDDDRLSIVSKASTPSQRSSRRSSTSRLNTAVLETPSPPPKKRAMRQYLSQESATSSKVTGK